MEINANTVKVRLFRGAGSGLRSGRDSDGDRRVGGVNQHREQGIGEETR